MLEWLPNYYRVLLTLFILISLTIVLISSTKFFGEDFCPVIFGIASVVFWIVSLARSSAKKGEDS